MQILSEQGIFGAVSRSNNCRHRDLFSIIKLGYNNFASKFLSMRCFVKKKNLLISCLAVFIAVFLNVQLVFAHEGVTVGDYELEVGWVNEPPVVGQQNGIVVNVMDTSSGTSQPVEDVSTLTVTVSYGGQSKVLTLQPLGEDTPGQFVAPILPTIPGQYTVSLGGKLGATDVKVDVQPEEVQSADVIQFPAVDASAQVSTTSDWLVWFSILIGLIGVGVGVTAYRKVSMR
jgi:hypothetical protein